MLDLVRPIYGMKHSILESLYHLYHCDTDYGDDQELLHAIIDGIDHLYKFGTEFQSTFIAVLRRICNFL
jgi:hypothetical protein